MKPLLTLNSSHIRLGFKFVNSAIKKNAPRGAKVAVAAAFGAASVGGLSVGVVLTSAAPAAADTNYFACAASMVEKGISQSDAIASCAAARYPSDLGACVVDVNEFTGLTASNALLVCQRSRRPVEVANCTINIHEALLESPSTKVLENCGRSLLPNRYGTCVVDIADAADVGVDEALSQCIAAGYRPWRIQPRL